MRSNVVKKSSFSSSSAANAASGEARSHNAVPERIYLIGFFILSPFYHLLPVRCEIALILFTAQSKVPDLSTEPQYSHTADWFISIFAPQCGQV